MCNEIQRKRYRIVIKQVEIQLEHDRLLKQESSNLTEACQCASKMVELDRVFDFSVIVKLS